MCNIKKQSLPVRHSPQRTCVACREVKDKHKLVRLVLTSTGEVEVDSRGKKTGRGAYLCSIMECWKSGLKKEKLEHALRAKLTPDNWQKLVALGNTFPSKQES